MDHKIIYLKEHFPVLGENGRNASVEAYLQRNMTEMGRQDRKRPVMIVCPGGGYGVCSQREAEPIATEFLPDGFNVFVLQYSVSPHRFPTQLQEIAALMELIYANSDAGIAIRTRSPLSVFSAGGHLVAHYSNAYDCPEVRAMFPESKPVNAAILGYPVISGDPKIGHMGSFTNLTGKENRTAEEIAKFSCDKLVSDKTPPTFLYHMAEDSMVSALNSVLYVQALLEHKVPCELHIYPHGYHGTATCNAQTCDNLLPSAAHSAGWLQAARKWLAYMGIAY